MERSGYFWKYASQYVKNVKSADRLRFLIFFVTSRCNLRCGPCFNWQNLNRNDDLSLEEIKKASKSIGRFDTLLLSGGEPFLRDELPEICGTFIENNGISVLSIPTNCTLPDRIIKFAEDTLTRYPGIRLSINPSLDGLKEFHDKSRCVEGVFDKVMETIDRLSVLKSKYGALEIAVNTVISDRNISELGKLMEEVFRKPGVDSHDFELIRGEINDKSLRLPAIDEIKEAHRLVMRNNARYLARKSSPRSEKMAFMGLASFVMRMKERSMLKEARLLNCTAGRNIGVIDANGDVRLCELLPSVGNLRQKGYDFTAIWNSDRARELRKKIIQTRCDCTHVCFIKMTGSAYFRSLVYLLYYYFSYLAAK